MDLCCHLFHLGPFRPDFRIGQEFDLSDLLTVSESRFIKVSNFGQNILERGQPNNSGRWTIDIFSADYDYFIL